jgi:hypothetical protein
MEYLIGEIPCLMVEARRRLESSKEEPPPPGRMEYDKKKWKKAAVKNRGCFTLVRIEIKARLIDVEMVH